MDIQSIKQRFEIIGNDTKLNAAIEKAARVAPTDISVLVTGESGVGKEIIPRIIHALSVRKHGKYIAVNCGAIPEGTIDSELFGHEKGAFTGAVGARMGYFEQADGGTIFLDEVGELPLTTQVRLLRVLENGEFIRVGSSEIKKTNVRIIAATNVHMQEAISQGKFREDLYYRLNTTEIYLPPLRERKGDIHLLFRKFAFDFGKKYNMPPVHLTDDAVEELLRYRWKGNIRQLRNVVEQISVLEEKREITAVMLTPYITDERERSALPVPVQPKTSDTDFATEREILYKILFDMRNDLTDLKQLTFKLLEGGLSAQVKEENQALIHKLYRSQSAQHFATDALIVNEPNYTADEPQAIDHPFVEELTGQEPKSLQSIEIELIERALERNRGKRGAAAKELGISERTLYRKIKQFGLE